MPKILIKENKFIWTRHSKGKIKQYRLSEKRVLRVFRRPERQEGGIAPGTMASMQVTGTKKHPTEIWLMYKTLKKPEAIKIISTWRYPGRTPKGQVPFIPEDTLENLDSLIA